MPMEPKYIGANTMKIFTDSSKWDDVWFRSLDANDKLIYIYLLDRSDHAGVWNFDGDALRFQTKLDFPDSEIEIILDGMHPKIERLYNGNYWIVNYITFQNPKGISRKFKHCAPIYRSLEKNEIDPEQFTQAVMDLETEGKPPKDDDVESRTVMDLWNTKLGGSLSSITKLTPSRVRYIKSATKEKISFFELFNKVLESEFLMGKSGKWKASFDWVIKPENRIKIMEGNYGASQSRRTLESKDFSKGF